MSKFGKDREKVTASVEQAREKDKKITIGTTDNFDKSETKNNLEELMPKKKKDESVKTYSFTMQPSIRKAFTKIAQKNGYKKDSEFFRDLTKNLAKELNIDIK